MKKRRQYGAGSISYIKAKKLYRLQIYLTIAGEKKRITKYAKTKTDADNLMQKLQVDIYNHKNIAQSSTKLNEYATYWLDNDHKLRQIKPSTITLYKGSLNRYILPFFNSYALKDITVNKVIDFENMLLKKGLSSATIFIVEIVLNLILKLAQKNGLIDNNAMKNKGFIKVSTNKQKNALSLKNAKKVIGFASFDDNYARWLFFFFTGMRASEILGIRIKDLDLNNKKYKLKYQLQRTNVKPSPNIKSIHLTDNYYLISPKSSTSRTVPLNDKLIIAIKDYLKAMQNIPNPYGLLFRTNDGMPISTQKNSKEFKQLIKGALGEKYTHITLHYIRHTVITLLADSGVDFQTIGQIVGHSTSAVTEIYRHIKDDAKIDAVNKLSF